MRTDHGGLRRMALALAGTAAAAAAPAFAQEAAVAAASPYTLTSNVGLVSQYVFRGVSYTQEKPAIQGGADLAHESGFYVGIWGSPISPKAIQNANGEIDLYGGYARQFGDFGVDVGLLQFLFPGGRYDGSGEDYETLEASVALSWRFVTLKLSQTLGDYFGFNDASFGADGNGRSRGSRYLMLGLAHDFGQGWSLSGHVGRQTVRRYGDYDFSDFRIAVAKDLGAGWSADLAWLGTNADSALYTIDGVDTGRRKFVASVVRSF